MMADEKVINVLDKWWKFLAFVAAGIFYGTIAWIRIGDNAEALKDIKNAFNKDLEIEKQKRVDRVTSTDAKFEKVDKRDDDIMKRVNELEKDLSYIKGTLNQNKK